MQKYRPETGSGFVDIKTGMKFWNEGAVWKCISMNECSALCQAWTSKPVTLTDRFGKTRTFMARRGRTTHLSNRSWVEEAMPVKGTKKRKAKRKSR